MDSSFADRCRRMNVTASGFVGAFIHRMSSVSTGRHSHVDLSLTQVPEIGDVMISMENIWYLKAEGMTAMEQSFVDGVSVTHLSADGDWPIEARSMATWFDGIPDLAMVRIEGPTPVDVVCSIVSIAVEGP